MCRQRIVVAVRTAPDRLGTAVALRSLGNTEKNRAAIRFLKKMLSALRAVIAGASIGPSLKRQLDR